MADTTDRFRLNTYSDGDSNWTHNDVVQQVDELAIDRGLASNLPSSGDYDGELYFAEDELTLFKWDGNTTSWSAVAGLGTDSAPLPQLSVEQDSLKVGWTHKSRLL